MACVAAPIVEAIAVTVAAKVAENKEKNEVTLTNGKTGVNSTQSAKIPFSRKLKWLCYLQWGGAFLLAFEHIWHGEIVPFFPFLTAVGDSAAVAEMLREIATVGVGMAIATTAVWACMLAACLVFEKRQARELAKSVEEN